MTLKAQMAADVSAVFLNEDEFAEAVTYYPANGAPQSISAVVDHDTDLRGTEYGTESRETVAVMVSRDSVPHPAIGDLIQLSGEDHRYSWTGQIEDRTDDAWWLVFSRPKLVYQGSTHIAEQ